MLNLRKLVNAGVHFGHQSSRWNPKMAPYIWGHRNGVHLIDVAKVAYQLENAGRFLEELVANGGSVLFVGTKKAARDIIFEAASALEQPYVSHRWIGGTLSNFAQVKKSVTRLLHYQNILQHASSTLSHYTKKELNIYQKIVERLSKNVGGIKKLTWPIGAVVIIDVRKEKAALREAIRMGVPVVALVDTNSDPSSINHVIPGNDDSPRSIKIIVDFIAESVNRGLQRAKEAKSPAAATSTTSVQAGIPQASQEAAPTPTPLAEESLSIKEEASEDLSTPHAMRKPRKTAKTPSHGSAKKDGRG